MLLIFSGLPYFGLANVVLKAFANENYKTLQLTQKN